MGISLRLGVWATFALLGGCVGEALDPELDESPRVEDVETTLGTSIREALRGRRGRWRERWSSPAADAGTADAGTAPVTVPGVAVDTPDAGAGRVDAGTAGALPPSTLSFSPVSEDFRNPERGFFYGYLGLTNAEGPYGWLANPQDGLPGYSLAGALVRLDLHRAAPLPPSKLDELTNALARIRAAGLKVILRFSYWDPGAPMPGDPSPGDATESTILGHVSQLAPVLQANADVIAMMHAGFIGPWGEWHHATTPLTDNADPFRATAAQRNILDALLRALPSSRMVQLRYPAHKMAFFGGAPLGAAQAYSETDAARVGHHNDCYFASFNDFYTYPEDPAVIASQKAYVAAETLYTPHGGETCHADPARTRCDVVVPEMAQLHTSNLNRQYNAGILASWQANGCFAEVSRRMGYRLELVTASHSPRVRPGGVLDLSFRLRNTGFSALYNPRPVFVVLDQGTTRYAARLNAVDPRHWMPGAEATVSTRLQLPVSAPAGAYRLSLWLPDDAEPLRGNPAYAIRFANAGTWDPVAGLNVLVPSLPVSPDAGGSFTLEAQAFAELP